MCWSEIHSIVNNIPSESYPILQFVAVHSPHPLYCWAWLYMVSSIPLECPSCVFSQLPALPQPTCWVEEAGRVRMLCATVQQYWDRWCVISTVSVTDIKHRIIRVGMKKLISSQANPVQHFFQQGLLESLGIESGLASSSWFFYLSWANDLSPRWRCHHLWTD